MGVDVIKITRLQRYYQKVPIDIGLFILIFLTMYESVIIGIISRLYLSEGFPIDSYLFNFIIAVILTFLVLIQMEFMYRRIMDVENLKVDIKFIRLTTVGSKYYFIAQDNL